MSTNVGGVPETLPSSYLILKSPNYKDMFEGIEEAILKVKDKPIHHPRVLTEEEENVIKQ